MRASDSMAGPVPPVFMFGFERSGTTLLSMMVGAHPEIAVPLTVTGMWYRYGRGLDRYGSLEISSNLEHLIRDLLGEERIRLWDARIELDELLREPRPCTYAAVVARFHQLYAEKKGKQHWGNLDIATLDAMEQAHEWFPSARFLHIVRDGRDVALSHETMPYGASNTLEAAERWRERVRTNLKMGAILGSGRYKVIRYEDLVSDTEETLGLVCRFVGVRYSPAMLDYTEMVSEKVPQDRRWLWPALDKPPDRSKIRLWKTKMSTTKRIVFEGTARDMLEQLGYETYERIPKSLRAYAYELWCFLGRRGRFRRLLARLGLNRPSKLERSSRGQGLDYRSVQKESFGSLVQDGVYGQDFEHSPRLRAFFEACMGDACARIETGNGLRVLDCGCGPGAWMDVVQVMASSREGLELYGFDLTPDMVEVARRRLGDRIPQENLHQGDVLSDSAYEFDGAPGSYQLIYAFDVVQQLPRSRQLEAVRAMLKHLDEGGCAVVFDHDRWSPYGLRMGLRKLVTKYLRVPLVPRYYCNARYPALSRFASRLAASGAYSTDVRVAPDGKKRALLVWHRGGPSDAVS